MHSVNSVIHCVSEKLRQNTFWMGRGGTLTHTISGIDIALWDILGKATGLPVSTLLGGNYRSKVQPLGSGWAVGLLTICLSNTIMSALLAKSRL
ncbi:hypothetical protein [Providencia rettgeri]|uniref:hypothetical protein n=1 Tax=Providencia rettgeri TaxID=587 RepID=UPI0022AB79A1|nr:hypothetical protein [Providencia rettgeri]